MFYFCTTYIYYSSLVIGIDMSLSIQVALSILCFLMPWKTLTLWLEAVRVEGVIKTDSKCSLISPKYDANPPESIKNRIDKCKR